MLLAGKGMRRVVYGSLKPIAFINLGFWRVLGYVDFIV